MELVQYEWTVFELKNVTVLTKPLHQIYMSLGAAATDKLDKYEAQTGHTQKTNKCGNSWLVSPCTMLQCQYSPSDLS